MIHPHLSVFLHILENQRALPLLVVGVTVLGFWILIGKKKGPLTSSLPTHPGHIAVLGWFYIEYYHHFQELVMDRETWHAAGHGVTKSQSDTTKQLNWTY